MGEIIAFGGGKGGSGKSFLASLTASLLAASGKRVVLADLDLGAANLHTFFSMGNRKPGLYDFLTAKEKDLEACVLPTSFPRLSLISSKSCLESLSDLPPPLIAHIIKGLKNLSADFIIMDLGAGMSRNNLDLFLAASRGVLVTTPEPTSVENVFRFVHALFLRKIQSRVGASALRELSRICLSTKTASTIRPFDLVAALATKDTEAAKKLDRELKSLRFYLLLNQIRRLADAEIGAQLMAFYPRFFGPVFSLGAFVNYDVFVNESIIARKPFLEDNKNHTLTRQIMGLVRQLLLN